MSAPPNIIPISGHVQSYGWGKRGTSSMVARLSAAAACSAAAPAGCNGTSGGGGERATTTAAVRDDAPYAELWFGTHPAGESRALVPTATDADGDALGQPLSRVIGGGLPFLLKVLSVRQALSIQAHPDKKLAEQLHAAAPSTYKDDNHKPEMSVCVGAEPFQALCGFRPASHIVDALVRVPELRQLCGGDAAVEAFRADATSDGLRRMFTCLMRNERVAAELALALRARLAEQEQRGAAASPARNGSMEGEEETTTTTAAAHARQRLQDALALRLCAQYPGDVGVFAPYFFNYVELQPGEAFYMGPNEPHAYLHGDCVEIMACSDNVVRAGLTPKLKDVDTLCRMLTYRAAEVGKVRKDACGVFKTPAEEFQLEAVLVGESERDGHDDGGGGGGGGVRVLPPCRAYSIILALHGEGWMAEANGEAAWHYVGPGRAFVIAPCVSVYLRGISTSSVLQVFRAAPRDSTD